MTSTRREFLRRSVAAGAIISTPYSWARTATGAQDVNSQLTMASIGVGGSRGAFSRGGDIAMQASKHARMIAVCDVDELHCSEFNSKFDNKLNVYGDYRKLFEKEKPDLVTIGTPDHWHVPIAIRALKAGCDVYCEKPLTLTIEEGLRIRDAVKETGRVFQVGTQQRSEFASKFLQAIAIVQSGRLGKNVKAHVAIGGSPAGGPFPNVAPPPDLNWDFWVGPAQEAEFSPERHKEFRWYYDYSGGKMTDWGAHHIDIAQWALGFGKSGPVKLTGTSRFGTVVPPNFNWIDYLASKATLPNGFETPVEFSINCEFDNGAIMHVCDQYDAGDGKTKFENGILFEGENGRIFVNRERLTGKPIEDMTEAEKKTLQEQVVKLYRGEPGDHMGNFFQCIQSRKTPISDVEMHHRTMTSCHLCNITLMLGREIHWDPVKEAFKGDPQATSLMSRPRREKFSWAATT